MMVAVTSMTSTDEPADYLLSSIPPGTKPAEKNVDIGIDIDNCLTSHFALVVIQRTGPRSSPQNLTVQKYSVLETPGEKLGYSR